jgi:hypothetical protein
MRKSNIETLVNLLKDMCEYNLTHKNKMGINLVTGKPSIVKASKLKSKAKKKVKSSKK